MVYLTTRQLVCLSSLLMSFLLAADPLPVWVSQPTHSAHQLQAIGEGVTLREAQRNARAALGADISVTVAEKFTSRQIKDGDFFREIINLTTHSEVTGLWMVGAQISKQAKVKDRWYAQATLPYQQLIKQQQQLLENMVKQLSPLLSEQGQPETFMRWWQLRQLGPQVAKAESAIVIITSFASEPAAHSARLATSNGILKQYYQEVNLLRQQISVAIDNQTRHKPFRQLLSNQLADEQLHIVTRKSPLTATLVIDASNREKRFGNELHLFKQLNVKLMYGQAMLSEQHLTTKAVSFGRSKDAHHTANTKLEKALNEQSLIHSLFNQSM
mgnify:FL=1